MKKKKPSQGVSTSLQDNLAHIRSRFTDTPDLTIREFVIASSGKQAILVYLDGLTNRMEINQNIMHPLLFEETFETSTSIGGVKNETHWDAIELGILQGKSALFIDGHSHAILLSTEGWPQRNVEAPHSEASIKGSHQGFVETGMMNIAMIRRYITNHELKIKEYRIGRRSQARVWIMYLADVAEPELLHKMETRLQGIDVDGVLNSGDLAAYLEDDPFALFPQLLVSERPDSTASQILQGRYVIVVDRSPNVLILPATFTSMFQNVDDYDFRWMTASIIRMLRYFGFLLTIFLPAIYIAAISFNYEIIPLDLLLSIGESREHVPFPPLVEAIIMELTIEMLREAGIRLPAPIGQTVGIVGGIVIGQAAVQAGIVSNIMVIVVAATAIASFIIPSIELSSASRLLRFPMMIIASLFGIFGIVIGSMLILAHLISMSSLGRPFTSPLAPTRLRDWKDTFVRMPHWMMLRRPESVPTTQKVKQVDFKKEDDTADAEKDST